MELDKMTLELTWDELEVIQTAVIYLRTQRRRESEIYQRRVEDPGPAPGAKERAAYLLSEVQKDLKLLEQARISIRKARVIESGFVPMAEQLASAAKETAELNANRGPVRTAALGAER